MSSQPSASPLYCSDPVRLRTDALPIAYPDAVAFMELTVEQINANSGHETVWFLQHPALYTAGTSAQMQDLVDPDKFPVFKSGRGGQYTYHGPGQRVVYVMLDLKKRSKDVRAFVCALEDWIIETLAEFGIESGRREGRVGVWVTKPDGSEAKIAALGIRIRKWVNFHGISINLDPDLSHFSGIVPCGIAEHGVTSFKDLGKSTTMEALDAALKRNFEKRFGPLKAD